LFKETGVRPVGVTITGGQRVTHDHDGYHVPKAHLVSALQLSLQSGQLKISPKLEHAATFHAEARDFRVTVNLATGHESFTAWRESTHDDLILSVAMATWFFSHRVDRQRHVAAVSTARARLTRGGAVTD